MEQQILIWLLGLVGALLLGMVTYILNDIRQSIRDIKTCLSGLRTDIASIDRRVVRLETFRIPIEHDEFRTYSDR